VNGGAAYGYLKQDLFELIREQFAAARARKKELMANQDGLRAILKQGADKARAKAVVTLDLVRDRAGLRY
jgi:tryptophanyl-tRNA synthetase